MTIGRSEDETEKMLATIVMEKFTMLFFQRMKVIAEIPNGLQRAEFARENLLAFFLERIQHPYEKTKKLEVEALISAFNSPFCNNFSALVDLINKWIVVSEHVPPELLASRIKIVSQILKGMAKKKISLKVEDLREFVLRVVDSVQSLWNSLNQSYLSQDGSAGLEVFLSSDRLVGLLLMLCQNSDMQRETVFCLALNFCEKLVFIFEHCALDERVEQLLLNLLKSFCKIVDVNPFVVTINFDNFLSCLLKSFVGRTTDKIHEKLSLLLAKILQCFILYSKSEIFPPTQNMICDLQKKTSNSFYKILENKQTVQILLTTIF